MSRNILFLTLLNFLFSLFLTASKPMKEKADLVVLNGTVYTVDPAGSHADAMAIYHGKIVAVGTAQSIIQRFETPRVLDLQGKFVYPGFIDAHCHFMGYALGLQYVDLTGCTSFAEVLDRLKNAGSRDPGKWLVGRGWDQNLWQDKQFPDNTRLNDQYPGTPVMLIRIDGHVVLANDAALRAAGFDIRDHAGNVQVGVSAGRLTGILSETAADKMRDAVPQPRGAELTGLLQKAEMKCFSLGLTTVSDAGLENRQVRFLDTLQRNGKLAMQIYAMLTPDQKNLSEFVLNGPFITDKLVVRSIKVYADGSLGSRTAKLKLPYADAPQVSGIIVTSPDSIRELCEIAYKHGYQVNTHCIGDSANHLVLNIYRKFLKRANDLRWRIEHAQVVDPADRHLFGDHAIIPSVQATHATSDMRWAGDRLGPVRIKGAYAYKDLMRQNGWIANGTDFPIENISPLLTFYAAVARKDLTGFPEGGYMPENALSREEALRSITIWAVKADFMEASKGSLETGKDADFVVLDQDIMQIPANDIPGVTVLETYIRGERVYPK